MLSASAAARVSPVGNGCSRSPPPDLSELVLRAARETTRSLPFR
ncbi:MAG TPA: hypothetical protein VH008_36535 [Pseudonocardia sp.]|nr:hypothetical protein [Pseudonocardia sp.]